MNVNEHYRVSVIFWITGISLMMFDCVFIKGSYPFMLPIVFVFFCIGYKTLDKANQMEIVERWDSKNEL